MSAPPECLGANPDVSGIGIRIAFYINTLLIAAVPRHPPFTKLLAPLKTNNGLNGLALLITAVAQSSSKPSSLSLYHALIVLHMLAFLGIATSTAGEYSTTQMRFRIIAFTSWCSMVAFFYLTMRVWITVKTFGSQPECNDWTIYVIWGVSVRATVPWLRGVALTLVSLVILKFLFGTTKTIMTLCFGGRTKKRSTDSIDTESTGPPGFITRCIPSFNTGRRNPGLIARVLASIYSVIMLELTIRRNPSSDEEKVWSFGQIIALLITLMTVNEIAHFALGEDLGLGKLFGGLLNRLRRQKTGPDLDTDNSEIRGNGNMELHRRDPELGEGAANHQNRSHDEIEHYR
ncbi:hypothetical protein FRC19_008030 [Serendipita sp. 401]|nr:hypothetical protein FRC19_008030 [Serendipita sp. 401]KAG9055602.1 hypothetical protein FS842_001747 [Serendipita sp. 407]